MKKVRGFIIAFFILVLHTEIIFASTSLPSVETDERMTDSWYLSSMECMEAWKVLNEHQLLPGQDVVIAVIDTGLDMNCNELKGVAWRNEQEYYGLEGVDDDQNGYIDDVNGLNLANSFSYMTDIQGHGTQMAGIIGMQPGNGGGVGVAYGAKIMPIKVSKDTNFDVDFIVEGIQYAVDMGADIINMSFASYQNSEELSEALKKASEQCVLVAAAGNEKYVTSGSTCDKNILLSDGYKIGNTYPAGWDYCIGVMAYDQNEKMASFSNWDQTVTGEPVYDLMAPGEQIMTVSRGNTYVTQSGTSHATAMVTGCVALMKGILGDSVSAPELKKLFLNSMKQKIRFDYQNHSFEFRKCSAKDVVETALEVRDNGMGNTVSDNTVSDNTVSDDSSADNPKEDENNSDVRDEKPVNLEEPIRVLNYEIKDSYYTPNFLVLKLNQSIKPYQGTITITQNRKIKGKIKKIKLKVNIKGKTVRIKRSSLKKKGFKKGKMQILLSCKESGKCVYNKKFTIRVK